MSPAAGADATELACDQHADEPPALEPAQQRRAHCAGRQLATVPQGGQRRPLRSRQPLAAGQRLGARLGDQRQQRLAVPGAALRARGEQQRQSARRR